MLLLPPQDRPHGKKHSMVGHKGCLYSHLQFLLRAVGQADCFAPQYLHSLHPDPNIGEVTIMVTNSAPVSLRVYRVNTEGNEMLESQSSEISPQGTVQLLSGVNEVWRFRAVPPAHGVPERLLGEVLVDRYPATREFVITDCPSLAPPADSSYTTSTPFKGAMMFEDDVVFDGCAYTPHPSVICVPLSLRCGCTNSDGGRTMGVHAETSCHASLKRVPRCRMTGISSC